MSENALSADNQQGSSLFETKRSNPSETTRRSPYIHQVNEKEILAYMHGAMHDATLNKGKRIRFGQKYPEWLETLKSLLGLVGVNSWMYKEGKNRNFYILETVYKKLDFTFNPKVLQTKGEKIEFASIVGSWHPIKAKIFSRRMMI